jgi:microcystin-dependent protein
MKRIDFLTSPSGFRVHADKVFHYMQQTYQEGMKALANLAGPNCIVSGCIVSGQAVGPGWLHLNGELVRFVGGSLATSTRIQITETAITAENANGQPVDRYFDRTATLAVSGTTEFTNLRRAGDLLSLQQRAASLVNFEPAVIVSGCTVSGVTGNTSGSLRISAGTYVLGGAFYDAPAYAGTYPVYYSAAGYSTQDPGGVRVAFDPHTSQRAADVISRATSKVGELKDIAVLSDRFDQVTGLGRWEWKGWGLCDGQAGRLNLAGRVRVGRSKAAGDYNRVGDTGGVEEVAISIDQMPRHNHTRSKTDPLGPGEFGLIRKSKQGDNLTNSGTDSGLSGTSPDVETEPIGIPREGGGKPHENRMPYLVVLTVQRIANG